MPNGEEFEKKLAEWQEKTLLFQERSETSQMRLTEYTKQLEQSAPEQMRAQLAEAAPTPLKQIIQLPRWLVVPALGPTLSSAVIADIKREVSVTMDELERNDFYTRLYGEVPYAISTGDVTSADEVLSMLKPPDTLTTDELSEVKDIIFDMVTAITKPSEIVLPEELEYPELIAPVPVTRVPITIHQLSTQEIIKSLTIPRPPEGALTEAEWEEYLKSKGFDDEDIDKEQQILAEQLLASWADRNAQIEANKAAIAEMPDYKLTDALKQMVTQPGLALLEMVGAYRERVSMPLAGHLWKNIYPDIEAEYQRYIAANPDVGDWVAMGHAFDNWDAPCEGTAEWMLKYLLMEGIADPLTYVGWGIVGKFARPFGRFGRFVGAVDRGIGQTLNLPFDYMKKVWMKFPKTLNQRAVLTQNKSEQYVEAYLTKATGKSLRDMNMPELEKAAERAMKYAFENPQIESDMALAGRAMLMHSPIDEATTKAWATRLGSTLRAEEITKATVQSIDDLFEDFFWKTTNKLITPDEAVGRLLAIFHNAGDDAMRPVAKRLLEERAAAIVRGSTAFTRAKTPIEAVMALGYKNYRAHIIMEEAAATLARKNTGAYSTLIHRVDLRLQTIWRNGIDRWIVRPFAESYLTFGMYGPMNMLEDYFRSALGGVFPRRMSNARFLQKWAGVKYDPNLRRDAMSEMLGYFRTRPEGELNNWILQMGGLARGFGDKTYRVLVEAPGHVGMEVRRNFIDGRAAQILADMGGDSFKALTGAGPRKVPPSIIDKGLRRELQLVANDLKISGSPDTIRGAKDLFTRKKIVRNEIDNILKEHPNLPKSVRDYVMKSYDDDTLLRTADDIERVVRVEANDLLMDEFLRGPEIATQQYKRLADHLVALEVKNPQEMASAIQSVYKMSDIYGALPDQIIARATVRNRGLPLAERRATFDAEFDRIYQFLDAAGADIDRVVAKVKRSIVAPVTVQRQVPTRYHELTDYLGSIRGGKESFKEVNDFMELYSRLATEGTELPIAQVNKLYKYVDSIRPHIDDISEKYGVLGGALERGEEPLTKYIAPLKKALEEAFRDPSRANKVVAIDTFAQLSHDRGALLPYFLGKRRGKIVDFQDATDSVGDILVGLFDDIQAGKLISITTPAKPFASKQYGNTATRVFDIMTAKREYALEFRTQNMATRHEIFAGVSRKQMTGEFWDDFYRQMNNEYRLFSVRQAELDGQLVRAMEQLNVSAGAKITARAPIVVRDRPLAPQDIATLLGVRGDDISRALLDVLTVQNNKEFFVAYVRGMVRSGDVGFTKKAIGEVYDQIAYSLRVSPESMSWITGKQMELEAVRRELHSLYNSKMLPDNEIAAIGKYLDDTGDAVEKLMYKKVPVAPAIDWSDVKFTNIPVRLQSTIRKNVDALPVRFKANLREIRVGKTRILEADAEYFKGVITFRSVDDAASQSLLNHELIHSMIDTPAGKNILSKYAKLVGRSLEDAEELLADSFHLWVTNPTSLKKRTVSFFEDWFPKAPAKPPVRALKPEYADYDDMRQKAMDEAHKWYYQEYPDYTNANAFDAMMKTIYPYWTYESQRWFWLPRAFVRKPGIFTGFERWQDNTDYGYIHIPNTSVDINPFRGTVFGAMTTRLTRRDFPEYYDSLGAAGGLIEFNDYLTRFGFYPGAHVGIPLSMFGGAEQQMGEILPAIYKTPLNAMIAAFPESENVKWLSDHIFSDRFRDYMIILEVNKRGYNGSHLWVKVKEGIALTEEEQAVWDESRGEAAFYGVGFEQFGMFRLRTDEQYAAYEKSAAVIEEMTGYTVEQQDWLRRHGYRIWDMVGGLSPTNQAILQELESYKWLGTVTPLLPSRQQRELKRLDLDWDDVTTYAEANQQKKAQLQQDFLSGKLGPRDYNDRLQGIYTEQRSYIDKKMEDNPNMTLEGRKDYYKRYGIAIPVQHPMRELLNLYFSIELNTEAIDDETGEIYTDWDTFFAQRQAIEDAIPEELIQEWEAYLSRNTTRIEEIRRDVSSKYFRKYYDIWEVTLEAYPEEEQKLIREFLFLERTGQQLTRQAEIRELISAKTGNQLISSFRSDVSDNRAALRYANPHLDAWLFFWGRVTSFKTPQAEVIYQQIARDTGRQI